MGNRRAQVSIEETTLDTPGPGPAGPNAGKAVSKKANAYAEKSANLVIPSDITPVSDPSALLRNAQQENAAQAASVKRLEDIGFLDRLGASAMDGLVGAVARHIERPPYVAVPGFVIDPKLLVGHTEEDQYDLLHATSQYEADDILKDIQARRDRREIIGSHGVGAALGASFLGQLPEAMATGMLANRAAMIARVGATQFAAAGKTGGAWASAVAENVAGNEVALLAQQALDGHVTFEDHAMSIGLAGVLTPLTSHGIIKEHEIAGIRERDRAQAEAAIAAAHKRYQASAEELGPLASPEDIARHADSKEAARLQEEAPRAVPMVPEQRVPGAELFERPEEVEVEAPALAKGPESVPKPLEVVAEVPEVPTPKVPQQPEVLPQPTPSTATKEPSAPTSLSKELSGAKPRYSFGDRKFSLEFASDVDKAAFITAQARKSKSDQAYLDFAMQATGMDEAGVRAHGLKVREQIKAQAKDAEPGKLTVAEVSRPNAEVAAAVAGVRAAASPALQPPEGSETWYHGGMKPTGDTVWMTKDKKDAEAWARRHPGMQVWAAEVDKGHPLLKPDTEFGVQTPQRLEFKLQDLANLRDASTEQAAKHLSAPNAAGVAATNVDVVPARPHMQNGTATPLPPDRPAEGISSEQAANNLTRWFADSKVVDDEGSPLVVYHGTSADFSTFDKGQIKRTAAGKGFYFTSDPSQRGYSEGNGANVMPVYLRIQNPTNDPHLFRTDLSYDGLIYSLKSAPGVTWYAVRDPAQIKSAIGNSGEYALSNPSIVRDVQHVQQPDGAWALNYEVNYPGAGQPVIKGQEGMLRNPAPQFAKEQGDFFADPDRFVEIRGDDGKLRWMKTEDHFRDGFGGLELKELQALPGGLHILDGGKVGKVVTELAQWAHRTFLPDTKLVIAVRELGPGERGIATGMGNNSYVIVLNPTFSLRTPATLVHELGHVVLFRHYRKAPQALKDAIAKAQTELQRAYVTSRATRGGITGAQRTAMERFGLSHDVLKSLPDEDIPGHLPSLFDILAGAIRRIYDKAVKADGMTRAKSYWFNADEIGAEQFVKFWEQEILANAGKRVGIPSGVTKFFLGIFSKLGSLFKKAADNDLIKPKQAYADFFEWVRKTAAEEAEYNAQPYKVTGFKRISAALSRAFDFLDQPVGKVLFPEAVRDRVPLVPTIGARSIEHQFGIDLLPTDTPLKAQEKEAITALYQEAADPAAPWNNLDEEKLRGFHESTFMHAGSISLQMLKSSNPLMRMIAARLIESPSGAAGRRSTAAIQKHLLERSYLGNHIVEFQVAYNNWSARNGGSKWKDLYKGDTWQRFNREVALEIEARRFKDPTRSPADPAVKAAADSAEAAFERMRVAQVEAKTIGWAGLPETSAGYLPHKLLPRQVRNMSVQQQRNLVAALADQFSLIEGFDPAFSRQLAMKYLERVNQRALGGFDSPIGLHTPGAADMVEDALKTMGMGAEEVREVMKKFSRGGAGHTKARLQLDLTQEHIGDDGQPFKLIDYFNTDVMSLVRSQAQRVSGEVALANHGIMGRPHLDLIKRAMAMGDLDTKIQPHEVAAYDQMVAEFLVQPFGNKSWAGLDGIMQLNAMARLGGMGFTQLGETLNGIWHVGAAQTLDALVSMPRMWKEARALARGEQVENSILSSIEQFRGITIGTDSYKLVFPYDHPDLHMGTVGHDSPSTMQRLLHGGRHIQAKLSMWRAIHASQQRAFAEQIVLKALRYINEGKMDVPLADMGITPELAARLRADLAATTKFDSSGRVAAFDITKSIDVAAAHEFVEVVHRGVNQIIQGTFIGETGKWAHHDLLKLAAQFRTFGLTSMEKQWARQRGNYGWKVAAMMVMASTAMAVPMMLARTAFNAIGKEDPEGYFDKQTTLANVVRTSLNFVSGSGLTADFLDAMTALTGVGKVTGGRTAAGTDFVGAVVAPSADWVNGLWKGLQNTQEGVNPGQLLKGLPFANLPQVRWAVNMSNRDLTD